MNNNHILIPADVPEQKHAQFTKNYNAITRETERLFLFSCDHKIEHLNHDFYGPHANPQALHPEHMFRIASQGNIGAMATHLGLLARYARQYANVNYIVKLNAITNVAHPSTSSGRTGYQISLLWPIDDVITFKNNNKNISIPGVGITLYLGNEYEAQMLAQAAHVINKAHTEGLVAIIWIYFRGKEISQENAPELIAGAAGVGVSLSADFIKIKPPATTDIFTSAQNLKIACAAAGNSKVICSGGEKVDIAEYLHILYDQIHSGDAAGTATGRNIFQLPLHEAIALTHAISEIVYNNKDYETAVATYTTESTKRVSKICP